MLTKAALFEVSQCFFQDFDGGGGGGGRQKYVNSNLGGGGGAKRPMTHFVGHMLGGCGVCSPRKF